MPMEPCPVCGIAHEPTWPHDPTTMVFQHHFFQENGRLPTWDDAMDHCEDHVKFAWREWLKDLYGIDSKATADMVWGIKRESKDPSTEDSPG